MQDARNGEKTLLLNDYWLYSRYNPTEDANKWARSEVDMQMSSYFLIGLGLGYHLRALVELVGDKPIVVYYFEEREFQLFKAQQGTSDWWKNPTIQIVHDVRDELIDEHMQILIPNTFLKAIGNNHPLSPFLEDIKINQITYNTSAVWMEENFCKNSQLQDFDEFPCFEQENICLVASGPSLNETIEWLQLKRDKLTIFSVGSALKMLLAHHIVPDAVIISDPKATIICQLSETDYIGPLFYLSTANYQAVQVHKGKRYMLCQKGYPLAEELAKDKSLPLLETGGSVSTVALSLIEQIGFKKIFLFGQDLGFAEQETHAKLSTSGRVFVEDRNVRQVEANDGTIISTTPNLQTYLRWFERKLQHTDISVYNTAFRGAKMVRAPYINQMEFYNLIEINEKNHS